LLITLTAIQCGFGQDYYLNGEGRTINNDKVGNWEYFYDNGNLSAEGTYNKDGKQEAEWKFYHQTGQLKMTGNYNNGLREGEWKLYEETGVLSSTVNFLAGKFH